MNGFDLNPSNPNPRKTMTTQQRLEAINKTGGFISKYDLPTLISLDRLQPVLIRFISGIRLTTAVQYAEPVISKMESTGELTRDVQLSPFNATASPEPTDARKARP